MTHLRLLCSISVGFCLFTTGCGTDSLSGDNDIFVCPGELSASPTCEAFCERVVADCNALNAVTQESCIQGCECTLLEAQEISDECGQAQEDGFLCTSELDCQDVFEFFSPTSPDDLPCRDDVIAACEG